MTRTQQASIKPPIKEVNKNVSVVVVDDEQSFDDPPEMTSDVSEEKKAEVIVVDDEIKEQKPALVKPVPSGLSEKKVWIKMAKDHKTIIGDEHFDLRKGKKYLVTREQRGILARSPLKLLDPIID